MVAQLLRLCRRSFLSVKGPVPDNPSCCGNCRNGDRLHKEWLRPRQQHDVAELFTHICKRAQGLPDCCHWTVQRVAADGVPAEPGGDGPILMQLRHTNGTAHATLQDCFEGWHEQLHLYAIAGARPMLVVQLSRFVGHGVFCTKDTAEISLGSGVVLVPCIAARDVTRVPYKVAAAIMHIGASPMSGHYRAVLLSPGSEGAGALEGARITDDNTSPVPLCHAQINLADECILLFLTRVDGLLELRMFPEAGSGVSGLLCF